MTSLLTNGDFPDNKAVLQWLALHNAEKGVAINTVAYARSPDYDPDFIDLLRAIARQSGGQFRMVLADGMWRPE